MEYVGTKGAMEILGVKSPTTIRDYEKNGYLKVYRPFSNRKRFKVSDLLKIQGKG